MNFKNPISQLPDLPRNQNVMSSSSQPQDSPKNSLYLEGPPLQRVGLQLLHNGTITLQVRAGE